MLISFKNKNQEMFNWDEAARILNKVSYFQRRGFVSRESLIQGLSVADVEGMKCVAKNLSLPFESKTATHLLNKSKSVPVRLTHGAVDSLLRRNGLGLAFSYWHKTFLDVFRAYRWMRQQSGQARVQSLFLIGFVPAVSMWMALSQRVRFAENMSTEQGKYILFTALILFVVGVVSVRTILLRAGYDSSYTELKSVGGRYNFLTEIVCSVSNESGKLGNLYDVCKRSGRGAISSFARKLLLGFEHHHDPDCRNLLSPVETEFLTGFKSVYLDSPRDGRRWLAKEHQKIFEDFQAEESQKAALLSLRLLMPMAIFFLPALFLMLVLAGFSFRANAIN